jgi:hypothetical protein
LDGFLATGSRMLQHFFLGLLADVQKRRGDLAASMAAVEHALAHSETSGERFWVASRDVV